MEVESSAAGVHGPAQRGPGSAFCSVCRSFPWAGVRLRVVVCLARLCVFGVAVCVHCGCVCLPWLCVFAVVVCVWRGCVCVAWLCVFAVVVCVCRGCVCLPWLCVFAVVVCVWRGCVCGVVVCVWRGCVCWLWLESTDPLQSGHGSAFRCYRMTTMDTQSLRFLFYFISHFPS